MAGLTPIGTDKSPRHHVKSVSLYWIIGPINTLIDDINRHFSVTPYLTICPSTELYLRGAMSAVTGIYLFRLLLNSIFFVLRSFCTLTNSAYYDEMPHDGIPPV